MKLGKKIAAVATTLLLAGGGLLVTAAPASAHTGDLTVSYSCDAATGEYVGTAELSISQTGLTGVTNWKVGTTDFEGTPSSDAGLSGALPSNGAGTITLGTFRLPGDTTSKGPWVYAHTIWSDGFKKGSDGQSYENLGGDCVVPPPVVLKDAAASILTTPATCEADGTAVWDLLTNATGSELVQTPGAQTGVATAAEGHQFPDGSATQSLGYTIEPKLDPSKEPCYTPPNEANPNAVITAVCGAATFILTNPLVSDANQLTASFVVNVDGEFYDAYSAEAGARVEEELLFDEDSGDHVIEIYQAGTSEWKLIASATVTSDCVLPPVEPPVEEPPVVVPPVVEPPVVQPPVTAKVVSAPTELAETGLEFPVFPAVLVGGTILGGGAWLLIMAHRRRKVDVAE